LKGLECCPGGGLEKMTTGFNFLRGNEKSSPEAVQKFSFVGRRQTACQNPSLIGITSLAYLPIVQVAIENQLLNASNSFA
jgi:hypothetical protein